MLSTIKLFVAVAFIMLCLDGVWLFFRQEYHTNLLSSVQGSKLSLRIVPAALIYVLIPAAVIFFTYESKSLKEAALKGAALGASMYGVYDLTNYATFTNWTLQMTLTDVAWGTALCAAGATVVQMLK
jgi:uncharacterized membrane protein